MKRSFTIVLLLLAVVCAVSAEAYNVSFFTNHSISKVAYSIEHEGKMTDVNMTKTYAVSAGDKVYATVNTGSEYITVTSFKLRSYDGNKSDNRIIDAEKTEDGKLCFSLSDLGALKEWSVEPVLTRKPVTITMKCLVGEDSVAGAWKVNDETVNGDSYGISSLTDFTVSCTFDADAYYFVSSQPRELAESGGRVFFSLQKGSDESSAETDYTINLERYSSISLGENKNKKRFKRLVYNGEEYTEENIGKLKLKKGETFYVYTAQQYTVAKDSSIEILKQDPGNDEWKTELKVPEDSLTYEYVLNFREEKESRFTVEFRGFDSSEELEKLEIILNVSREQQKLEADKENTVIVGEGETLYIRIPAGTSAAKYSIRFSDDDDSLADKDRDDITTEYEEELSYSELAKLEKITITKTKGVRFSIRKQKEKAKESGVDIAYYASGRSLDDEAFLPVGTEISVCALGEIPENITVSFNEKSVEFNEYTRMTITDETTPSDLELDIQEGNGFWIDISEILDGALGASVVFKRGDFTLKGNVFIKIGDKITCELSGSFGHFSYDFEIATEDDDSKFDSAVNHVSSLEKTSIEERTKVITLRNPKYGSVQYYYSDGTEIQGSKDGDIYTTISFDDALDGCTKEIRYKYTDTNSGFTKPIIVSDTETSDGWSCEVDEDEDFVICTKELNQKNIDLTPIECSETDDIKPQLEITVKDDVIKSANGVFCLSYINSGKKVSVYDNGKQTEAYKKDKDRKISSTDAFTLEMTGCEIPEGKVLQIKYKFLDEKNKAIFEDCPRKEYNIGSYKISGFLSERGHSTEVKKIAVEISYIDAEKYGGRNIDHASVTVKFNGEVQDESKYLSPDDEVTLIVEPEDGYYIEGDEDNHIEKSVKYKNLDQELKKITVKEYILVTLKNIHPTEKRRNEFCTYKKNGEDVPYGTYDLKEGDKVTIILKNMGTDYKVNNPFLDFVAPVTNSSGNFTEDLKIESKHQGKTLTLQDFNIEEKKK